MEIKKEKVKERISRLLVLNKISVENYISGISYKFGKNEENDKLFIKSIENKEQEVEKMGGFYNESGSKFEIPQEDERKLSGISIPLRTEEVKVSDLPPTLSRISEIIYTSTSIKKEYNDAEAVKNAMGQEPEMKNQVKNPQNRQFSSPKLNP